MVIINLQLFLIMKNILLILFFTASLVGFSQYGSPKVATFDTENSFVEFPESYDKKQLLYHTEGFYIFENKAKYGFEVKTNLPLKSYEDFKVVFNFNLPVFGKNYFGITYNIKDEKNYSFIYIKADEYWIGDKVNGKFKNDVIKTLKVKGGKNIDISISIEKKAGKTYFVINGMSILYRDLPVLGTMFGIYLDGAMKVNLDSIELHQLDEE